MTTDIVILKLNTARQALAEAKTIQETKKILDVAKAAEIYAKRQQLGEEAIQYATAIKVEALAQLGRMLKELPRANGKRVDLVPNEYEVKAPYTYSELGLDRKIGKLAQDIAELPDEQFEKVKQGVVALSNIKKAHVANNTGEYEWYTPAEYIEAARLVMGSIDTDPASSELANKTVKATMFFTQNNTGLLQRWHGNVWMNPPYSQPLITQFANLLVEKYLSGEIKQACVLVNNATETNFYQNMMHACSVICFIKGRVKFIDVNGKESGAPLQGQTVLYFGKNINEFCHNFKKFGVILYTDER